MYISRAPEIEIRVCRLKKMIESYLFCNSILDLPKSVEICLLNIRTDLFENLLVCQSCDHI